MITNEIEENISPEIKELASEAEKKLIPAKSREPYYKEYRKFLAWLKKKNVQSQSINESVMLAYMMEMSKVYKSSTLWCIHSKLQAILRIEHNIDLASFFKLHAFMKGTNKYYVPKKSLVFTEEDLCRFFTQAPDNDFLFLKVVSICGLFGSCRRIELCNLRLGDISREGSVLIISIRPSKTEKTRKFAVVDDSNLKYADIFEKYLSLRPENASTDRVFLKYSKGKCTKQVVGINTFGKCPALIARFLNLPNCDKYTGHAFRRTSATFMVNGGMNIDELKRQVGWKSSAVASGYIEESISKKVEVSKLIAGVVQKKDYDATDDSPSPFTLNVSADQETCPPSTSMKKIDTNPYLEGNIQISNNQNCVINIHLK